MTRQCVRTYGVWADTTTYKRAQSSNEWYANRRIPQGGEPKSHPQQMGTDWPVTEAKGSSKHSQCHVVSGLWPAFGTGIGCSLVAPPPHCIAGPRGQSPETVIQGAALRALPTRQKRPERILEEHTSSQTQRRKYSTFAFSLPLIFSLRILISWFLC